MITLAAILTLIAGFLHGTREAFHADRKLFEKLLNVLPVSFFGSKQDTLKYNSLGEYKSIWWQFFPLDFWHVSRWLENLAVAGAVFAVTGVWYFGVAYIGLVATSGHLSYYFARKQKL